MTLVVNNNPGVTNVIYQALRPYLGDFEAIIGGTGPEVAKIIEQALEPFLGENDVLQTGTPPEIVNVIDQALPPVLTPQNSMLFPTPIGPQQQPGTPLVVSPTISVPNPPVTTPSAAVPTNPSIINVTPVGNFETQQSQALENYTIVSVVDVSTGLPPTNDSATLRITLTGGPSLDSYGIDLTGNTLQFTSGGPYTTTLPVRIINLVSGFTVSVPNQDTDGNTFDWTGGHSPAPGDTVQFSTARYNSENVFGPGEPLNLVIPTNTTTPVSPPPLIGPATIEVDVMDQELTSGFPMIVHII
jgi:hypothetical protein